MSDCTCASPQAVATAIDNNTQMLQDHAKYLDETLYGSSQQKDPGEHGKLDRLRFCHWAAPEWGAIGESAWVTVFKAAQLGIAALNAAIQGQIADLKEDLAEGYYQQAKYKWDRFEGKYMPLEQSILWEASSEPIKEMNCDDDRARAEDAVGNAYDRIDFTMPILAKAYRMCLDDTVIRQLEYSRSQILVDTENYNLRDDQWFVDFKNDQRWNRRSNILNLGRNLGSIAMQYGDVARKLMGDVSDIVNKAAGSLSQALGYYGSRFDTVYPTTYLAGTTESLVGVGSAGNSYGSYSYGGTNYGG